MYSTGCLATGWDAGQALLRKRESNGGATLIVLYTRCRRWGLQRPQRSTPPGGRLLAFICDSPPVGVGRRPPRGGGIGGGVHGGALGGGAVGRVGWGGVQVGGFGVVRGGGAGGGGGTDSPYSPCPQSNRTITINLTLTFAARWYGHASHVNWAAQDPHFPNFVHGSFCDIIALHLGPQHSF